MVPTTLYMVIPCYNEEEVLPITSKELLKAYNDMRAKELISDKSRILFVNDGSRDKTWEIISELHEENPIFAEFAFPVTEATKTRFWPDL